MKLVCCGSLIMTHYIPSNERNSLGRLSGLLKKLRRDPELLTQYDDIIRDQLNQGIVEKVANDPVGKEFYLPHRSVIRKSAESTKLRIVYDASSKESDSIAKYFMGRSREESSETSGIEWRPQASLS